MLAENGLTNLGKELPIHCIEMTRDRPTKEIAVLTRKRAETGGVPLMPPLEEHRRPQHARLTEDATNVEGRKSKKSIDKRVIKVPKIIKEYWGANIEDRIERLSEELQEDVALGNIKVHQGKDLYIKSIKAYLEWG